MTIGQTVERVNVSETAGRKPVLGRCGCQVRQQDGLG